MYVLKEVVCLRSSFNVLWDFDGTIFDTYPVIIENFFKVLGKREDEEEVLRLFKQSSVEVYKHYDLKYTEENLNKMIILERQVSPVSTPPFENVLQALQLTNKNVIVTNKDREAVEAILEHYKMAHLFAAIICRDEGFERKPDGASYAYIHNEHHIDLVVGDRELDFIPARVLGIRTCAFRNSSLEVDFHIEDYSEFEKVLLAIPKNE